MEGIYVPKQKQNEQRLGAIIYTVCSTKMDNVQLLALNLELWS